MGEAIPILRQARLAAVVQAPAREELISRALAATSGGLSVLAVPVSVPFVAEIVADIADAADVPVGLSDVVRLEHLNVALAAGAEFVFSPIFDPELIMSANARDLDIVPGAATPDELFRVASVHPELIAVVPSAALGGLEYIKWLHRTFPDVELVAMGGIGSDRAPHYLEHGAAAVVVDTGLFPEESEPASTQVIATRATALVELCDNVVYGERQTLV